MGFMKKEELLAEAERLGIDISTMKYQDQVAAVARAQRQEQEGKPIDISEITSAVEVKRDETRNVKQDKRKKDIEMGRKVWNEVKGKRIVIAPMIRPEEANVLFKYDEELGDDVEVEEVYYDLGTLGNPSGNVNQDGTFRIKQKTGKKVIAQSTIPKENAGIDYYVGDWFPTVKDPVSGREGYQYKKYVEPLLRKSGHFQEYAEYFDHRKYPNNVFYISGWSCCDKDLVNWIFNDINRKEQERKERESYGFRG